MRFLTAMFLSFVALGLTGSGCASGDADIATGSGPSGFRPRDASVDLVGSCNPSYCSSSALGAGCCLGPNGPCGIETAHGCVGKGRDGG